MIILHSRILRPRARGQTLTELGLLLMLVAVVVVRALVTFGQRVRDNLEPPDLSVGSAPTAISTPTVAPSSSVSPGPVLLARWTFDATCNGWWNAEWSGSGCEADGSPRRMESPLIDTDNGGTINVIAEGNTDGGPTNLVIKLAEYDGAAYLGSTNLGTLASSNPTLDSDLDLTNGTDRIRVTATGPGELRVVELWLYR